MTVDLNANNYMAASPGSLTVGPEGLAEPRALYGISGATRDSMYVLAIVHEGLHAAYYWAGNMWAGAERSKHDIAHQEPFNQAAEKLLR